MKYDIIVIGGGAVGLATAYQLLKAKPDLRVLLLEKESSLAAHQTGNNSNVIHSGIYYKPGSLKAINCIKGYRYLLDFCDEHHVPYKLCGKIIVAVKKKEVPTLKNIFERGGLNGLTNLSYLKSLEELRVHEPHVMGVAGIHVPQTGIIDYKTFALKLGEVLTFLGAEIRLNEKVRGLQVGAHSVEVTTVHNRYKASLVVNCAGLYSDKIAEMTLPRVDLRIIPFRGEYYKLSDEKAHLVKTLIYPVPDPDFPFLGVHFTTMINGGVECGPNAVLAFKREGYKKSDVDWRELKEILAWPGFRKILSKYWQTGLGEMYRSYSKRAFTRALQNLLPEVAERNLVEGGAGVRAQACDRRGKLLDDFLILEDKRAIHVCNAPSPAATSCLSIGETIARKILDKKV